eukprot:CAMPEP_0184865510 /NCGR_PEP_ID=MMETSP0580-20130426/18348_1 /TAXON_ID=1118495 /ORGANISM="Dactyliosolen fragilissimus" /LENGTH=521 /DNA_ID=CAMNT_0027364745 /DNA_START=254 /DNA_END=1819 /DNA_ORIENTATION=-
MSAQNELNNHKSRGVTTNAIQFVSPMHMSSSEDEEEEEDLDDELSKLIGKRDALRRSTSASASTSTSSSSTESSSSSTTASGETPSSKVMTPEEITSLYEGKTGMDMFEMPEFKTKRPDRISKTDEIYDKGRDTSGSSSDKNAEDKFIDFQAEYEDENEFHVPNRIGFGTMAWGDTTLGFKDGKKLKKKEKKAGKFLPGDLQVAYNKLLEHGITLMDTSELYGLAGRKKSLSSEQIIGTCLEENSGENPIVCTTMSNPWKHMKSGAGGLRLGKGGILSAIESSLERIGTGSIDLYQVPPRMFYLGTPGTVADALCDAVDAGLIDHIGVTNMNNKNSMERFANKLSKRGHSLTSNQFEFSLINRKAWKSGLIAACKELGVVPIAHTPLGGGLASGVYTATNPTGGKVSAGKQPYDFDTLDKYSTLHTMLETVQNKVKSRLELENKQTMDRRSRYNGPAINTDISTAQIAINYVVAKGCVPIPGIKNGKEADELIGCLGWALSKEEVKMLDDAADMSDKGIRT